MRPTFMADETISQALHDQQGEDLQLHWNSFDIGIVAMLCNVNAMYVVIERFYMY